MAGKFEVYQDKSGKFRFRLKAGTGQIVARGEVHNTNRPRRGRTIEGARSRLEAAPRLEQVGAPLPVSAVVRAVVLDANVMSRGRLTLDVIDEIVAVIEERELDAEVWVPEPVVWEWAEHACSDLHSSR